MKGLSEVISVDFHSVFSQLQHLPCPYDSDGYHHEPFEIELSVTPSFEFPTS